MPIYKIHYAQYFIEQISLSTLYKACSRGVDLHGSIITPIMTAKIEREVIGA